jgi:amino acid adenylation domain-containing protein
LSTEQLLTELRTLDIRLSVDGDRLRCSAPKGRLTRELEEKIAAHKLELLFALREPSPQNSAFPRSSSSRVTVPLSFAQERFWFLQSFDPESTDYNIIAFQRVPAPVDAKALESALDSMLQRHEILRTNFLESDGSLTQVVRQKISPELTIHDLCHLTPSVQPSAIESLLSRLAKQPFDLADGPLLRVALIRVSDQDQRIVLVIHHIISDAWSIGIFFAELKASYEGLLQGRPLQSPRLPVQYRDYALWERERHSSGTLTSQIDYWKNKLKGAPPYLDLPTDRARSASTPWEPNAHRFELGGAASESLRLLARREGATPFMALLAIFKAVLSRYARQNDIVVGTPVSTRTHSELEQLIGCFINTHALRTEIPAGLTTRELLARVRVTVLESLSNADVPFETIVSEMVAERDLSRSPLFQTAFILQNTPMSSDYHVVGGGTTFEMTLYMWESNRIYGGRIEYNANLFKRETVACFAACFETLAAQMAAQPDSAIDQFPLLTAAQEAEWFDKDNGPHLPYPDICAHEWIERQAEATPDAIAASCGSEQLSFRELSTRSNRLAHRLRGLGVGSNSLVALCLDRSLDLVVAPLAVWKAGGAYIPLDPEYPDHRLALMLEDSAAAVLVTESHLLKALPSNLPKLICLDRDRQSLEEESPATPTSSTTPGNLAYVIYTSGSTGKPKGVEITQRSLVNFLASMQREPGMTSSDRLLAVTTFSFDIAGLELYLPLVSGGQVVIAPRSAVFDGSALARLLSDEGITTMQATPVTWRLLLESGWQGTPGLRVLCGGEALPTDLAQQLAATGSAVWNLYGPTETTIWSTMQRIDAQNVRVSIGRPIANTQICVLDEHRHPLPLGVAGELYIGGDGLAKGYLHREELTAERFIESSFHAGKRLYRTGDLARRSPDGALDYIGRVDNQVKVRGFRIELGEIEAALERQSGISHAVVVVREDHADDRRLTAYVTAQEQATPDPGVLRKALLGLLPEYMVPSAFVQVDQFPLTPNRKVDRKALLAPEYRPRHADDIAGENASATVAQQTLGDENITADRYLPPSNHVELVMTEIWRDVLGIDKVSVLDNFFELGGHSLTAARLISRLRSALGMDLPLRCIFIHPTIAGLASHISYDGATHGYRYTSDIPKWNCLVPAQPKGTRTPLFFVGGYQSADDTLLVLSQLIPNLGMDQPVFGFRPRWIEGNGDDYASVEEMAREFLAELRMIQPTGPYLLGGHCVGGIAALEVARLLLREGEEVRLMALLDTERPTPIRTFLTDLHFMRRRILHIATVLSRIIRPGEGTRKQMIRDLTHRKLKIAPSAQSVEEHRFYQAKVRYRRLLYSHTSEKYAGRITLLINEKQARYDKDFGWSGIARDGLEVHALPGDHTTILTQYGKEVARVILHCIGNALAKSDGQVHRTRAHAS